MNKPFNLKYALVLLLLLHLFSFDLQAQLAQGQDKFLGNTHSMGQTPLNFDLYWDQLTPGNAGKWASCEQARDDFNYWLWLDRAYEHAREFELDFKEHTLVWGHSSGEPSWMSSVPQAEQMDEVLEWYMALSERYPDLELIDVVNEPLHAPPSYTQALGGSGATGWDWVIWCFEKAREYFPNATLVLNEYNVLNYTSTCDDFLVLVELLQERNLIDGIGLQAHSLETIGFNTIQRNLEVMASTGLDIYISELDLRGDDATQLALYQQLFPYFWEHPSVKGVTLWGYLQGDMWRAEAYLLAADGVTERPALQWLRTYFDYTATPGPYEFRTYVTGEGSVSLSPSGGEYAAGSVITATAVPAEGYVFSYWTGDIVGSTNPTSLAMTSNRFLVAHFTEEGIVPTYALDVSVSGGGVVLQDPTGDAFTEGTAVMLTAIPDEGYQFSGWSGDVNSSSESINVIMDTDKDLIANFISDDVQLVCDNPTPINISFSQDGVGEYCFITSDAISYINSWNMDLVEINGVDLTNTWSNTLPDKIDGYYYIHYVGIYSWSHFQATSPNARSTDQNAREVHKSFGTFPNPVANTLNISLSNPLQSEAMIHLYDYSGRSIRAFSTKDELLQLDMSGLSKGIYFLTIQRDGEVLNSKFYKK